jgi:hypothetical protein
VSPSRWGLAALAGAGLFLAACSNSPSHSTTTTTSRATTTSSSTTSTTAASTTSSTTASAACNHISASAGQSEGAAGTITGVVTVTNSGPSACTVDGYATVALYSGSGAPLTVTMVNGLSVDLSPPANAPPASVTIASAATAQFAYQYSDVTVSAETSCPTSEQASVIMPGATSPSPSFALAIAPCGNGTIHVSPLYQAS